MYDSIVDNYEHCSQLRSQLTHSSDLQLKLASSVVRWPELRFV